MKRFALLFAGLMLCGCTVIKPSDQALIASQAQNAAAMDAAIQKNTYIEVGPDGTQRPAGYINQWWKSEDATWQYMKSWSQGQTPTTQP